MSDSRPIGVFDSGIGGLTVVRALTHHLPHENIIYFGDTARVPYGSKSPQVVRDYAAQDTDVLLQHKVKIIVVACNTVSAVALDVVQKRSRVPVVGVIIPGAEAAVQATKKKRVGVIGTVGTIKSDAYVNALRQIDPSVQAFSQACPLFVPLAEEGWTEHKATELIAKEYLFPLTLEKIDALILGCTHYPLLRNVIDNTLHHAVALIDSGEATAQAVAVLLEEQGMKNMSRLKPNLQFYVSDVPHKFTDVGERFLGQRLGKVHRVPAFPA
ncbi:MAG: glutamate racemase [Ignavibacteria bacterium]|nr:glutamate racemase [Ignavibacteria bacterium]